MFLPKRNPSQGLITQTAAQKSSNTHKNTIRFQQKSIMKYEHQHNIPDKMSMPYVGKVIL